MSKFRGRPRTTLPVKIHNDMSRCELQARFGVCGFKDIQDLEQLERISANRDSWSDLCKLIYDAAQAEAFLSFDTNVDAVVQN